MTEAICKCPKCGGDLRRIKYVSKDNGEEREFISCSNYKEKGCKNSIPATYFGTKLTDEQVKDLVEKGKTSKQVNIKVFLKMEDDKVKMDFSK